MLNFLFTSFKLVCGGKHNIIRKTSIFVRAFHSLLTVLIFWLVVSSNTGVHESLFAKSTIEFIYGILFIGLSCLSLLLYHFASWIDPGYVAYAKEDRARLLGNLSESDDDAEMQFPIKQHSEFSDLQLRYCLICKHLQPLRSRHCEDCDRCVRKYDHHCPWLDACVGERNHRFFLGFLAVTAPLAIWAMIEAWSSLSALSGIQTLDDGKSWLDHNWQCFLVLVICALPSIVLVSLLVMHTYLACVNLTTWEFTSRQRITYLRRFGDEANPFHEGYCKNLFRFLCYCPVVNWEQMYRKALQKLNVTATPLS